MTPRGLEDSITADNLLGTLIAAGDGVTDAIKGQKSPEHAAFCLLGQAAIFFYLAEGTRHLPELSTAMEEGGQSCITLLRRTCPEKITTNLDIGEIAKLLTKCRGDNEQLRKALINLQQPLKILLVLADVRNEAHLRLMEEKRILTEALRNGDYRDAFVIEDLTNPRIKDFGPALAKHRPTIVHFSGHGESSGLLFCDAVGDRANMEYRSLNKMLSIAGGENLRGVVMNACYSADHMTKIRPTTDTIVMEGELKDQAAIDFSGQFYAHLGGGRSFKEAFDWTEAAVDMENAGIKVSFIASFV